ncbi:MAG: serine/threonine-protein kinase [Planctomycetes bacterium]|nr:serine/threonine-protein kinase [Planctomycetota bacterium]
MARVVCPSCKTGFEAAISREDYTLNCVHCGIAFNAAQYLPREDFLAIGERRPPNPGTGAYDRGSLAAGNVIRPYDPTQTGSARLPFMYDDPAMHAARAARKEAGNGSGAHAQPGARPPSGTFRAPWERHLAMLKTPPGTPALSAKPVTPARPTPILPPAAGGALNGAKKEAPAAPAPKAEKSAAPAAPEKPVDPNSTSNAFFAASSTTARFRARDLQKAAAEMESADAAGAAEASGDPSRLKLNLRPTGYQPRVNKRPPPEPPADVDVKLSGVVQATPAKADEATPAAPATPVAPAVEASAQELAEAAPATPVTPAASQAAAEAPAPAATPEEKAPTGEVPKVAVTPGWGRIAKPEPASPSASSTGSSSESKRRKRRPLLEGQFGPYEIEGEIARGGVGAVFRAREKAEGRHVALKVLLDGEEAGELERERFRRECETAKSLALPGMVQIFAVGEVDGKPFMAMELVEGRSLDKIIPEKNLSVNDCLVMMQAVAETVGALHEAGYVHRDLKPANILLDHYGTPKVADFGLVKSLDEVTRLTASGLVCGTPAYMAPEQARGDSKAIDPRSDVWALGAVLYEMLTAEPPFHAENALRLMLKITKETPRRPRHVNPKVPRDVEAIVLKCLAKQPDGRYPNARALAQDIARFLEGQPIEARSAQPLARALRAVEEHRGTLGAVAAGLAAVVLVTVLVRAVMAPAEAGPFVTRGETALGEERFDDAAAAFRQALRIDAKNGRAHLGLGRTLANQGLDRRTKTFNSSELFHEALRHSQEARALDQALDAEASAQIAQLYYWARRYKDELSERERAVERSGRDPEALQRLALACWNVGAADRDASYYDRALVLFQEVLQVRPDFPKTREYIKQLQENFLAPRTATRTP